MRLKGKRALVTGASGEIGRAIVARLAQDGAEVAAAGRSQAKLEALAGALGRDGHSVHPLVADLTDEGACEALIAGAEAALGGLDGCLGSWRNIELVGRTCRGLTRLRAIGAVEMRTVHAVRSVNMRGAVDLHDCSPERLSIDDCATNGSKC